MTRTLASTITLIALGMATTQVAVAKAPAEMLAVTGISALLGDVNNDCVVGIDDMADLLQVYGKHFGTADFNNDGYVNETDRTIIESQLGLTCSDRLIGDVDGSGVVDNRDLMIVIGYQSYANAAADIDHSGLVDETDVNLVMANLGQSVGQRILGDVNGDAIVGSDDLVITLANLGSSNPLADVNSDGIVDEVDHDIVSIRWGATASMSLPGDVNGDGLVNAADQGLVLAFIGSDWPQADLNQNGLVDLSDLLDILALDGDSSAQRLVGDVSGDGIVSTIDVDILTAAWGTDFAPADVNGDGTVDLSDLLTTTSTQGDTVSNTLLGDIDGNCTVNKTDVMLMDASIGTDWLLTDLNDDGQVTSSDLVTLLGNVGTSCE